MANVDYLGLGGDNRLKQWLKLGLEGLVVLLLLFVLLWVPRWYAASWELQDIKDTINLEGDTRTTLVQIFGGLFVIVGLYFTAKTLHTTQEGQITDRFTKAINQLGEAEPKKMAIRLGGIYALARIARDSERDHWPIMEVLTAYVREHAPWKEEEPRSEANILPSGTQLTPNNPLPLKPATDIQAILTVLGRRGRIFSPGDNLRLDLTRIVLRGANLEGAHPEGTLLRGAHLEKADFLFAHLEWADLRGAQLKGANLWCTCLHGVFLDGADLEGAKLESADLSYADRRGAQLKGTRGLTVEQLCGVKTLYQAELDPSLLEQIRQQCPQRLEKPDE